MANATDYQRLRDDIGATVDSLSDEDADAIFVEAGETYSDAASLLASTRVIALRRLLASSAKMTSYTQNNSREELSDVFKHLTQLLAYWRGELDTATRATGSTARFGKPTRIPRRIKEYPG